jgi:diguanylate cyclase (GGDEF)-like protein
MRERAQRWIAAAVCAALVILAAVTLPVARHALPVVDAFLPIYLTLAVTADAFVAFLLAMQFRATGQLSLGVLSTAYALTATLALAQMLAFPALFTPTGMFAARPQTAVWLWAFWHGGFPIVVTAYAVTARFRDRRVRVSRSLAVGALGAGCGIGLLVAAIAYRAPLPTLVVGGNYLAGFAGTWQVVIALLVISIGAMIVFTRLDATLDLWVTVALVGFACDVTLTLWGGSRFSMGWYLSRVYAIVTALIVAAFFVAEFAHLYARFARLATIDALTGVANRRSFDDRLDEEFRAAIRDHGSLSLLMLDVDDFKKYNDAYGHIAGDDALRAVAQAARAVVNRPRDLVARYGGEEFAVILSGTDLEGALTVGERIRAELERRRIPHKGNRAAPYVTVSIGAATSDAAHRDLDQRELIARADAALYAAKDGGRNRVVGTGPRSTPALAG